MSLLKNSIKFCRLGAAARNMSTGSDLVLVDVNSKTGVATVTMNRPPVNSLNTEHLDALHRTFVRLENEKCRGMILTSSSPTVFSAGLDIREMYKPELEKARKFWRTLQDMWLKLYSSPYPTVAAINGHAPAGGCLLSLSCEYRVIVPNVKMGLNETQLGIVAPQWFQDCMRNVIGERQAEKALISGRMFTSEEALAVGLVDEIAPDKAACIERAEAFLASQGNLPWVKKRMVVLLAIAGIFGLILVLARKTVKLGFRNSTLSRLLTGREADTKIFIDYIFQPKVQKGLEMYLQSLSKKSG